MNKVIMKNEVGRQSQECLGDPFLRSFSFRKLRRRVSHYVGVGGEGNTLQLSVPKQLKKKCITKYSLELLSIIVLGLWAFFLFCF